MRLLRLACASGRILEEGRFLDVCEVAEPETSKEDGVHQQHVRLFKLLGLLHRQDVVVDVLRCSRHIFIDRFHHQLHIIKVDLLRFRLVVVAQYGFVPLGAFGALVQVYEAGKMHKLVVSVQQLLGQHKKLSVSALVGSIRRELSRLGAQALVGT